MSIIKKLTDKMRFDLANGKVVTSYGDFELKKYQPKLLPGKPTLPAVPGGIFDSTIFGSPYLERCDCGFTTGKGNTCPKCHSHINTDEEMLNAVGLIKAPFYFINSLKLDALNKLLDSSFKSTNFASLDISELYTRFFAYRKDTDELLMSEDVTQLTNPDFTNLSIEGLIKIFEEHKRHKLDELMFLVQRYILVRPVSMRPWSYTYKSWLGTRTLEMHQLNYQYKSLIYISTELVNQINLKDSSAEDLVYSIASIRLAITKIMDGVSDLLHSSKFSSIRQGYGTRVPNSARGVAVADPNLTINQVSLPIGMCYEIFRTQFISWVFLGIKLNEDEVTLKMINKDKEMVALFKKFVSENQLYVMINRAPTLYKLSQLVFEVTLNEGSSIGYSLMATTPLNLDFDGDTLAVYAIPDHLKDKIQQMLPSNVSKYMKSDTEVILPKQETLIGLMIASKWDAANDKSQKIKVSNLEQAQAKYEEGLFDSNDIITIGTQTTTYGRAKLSAILGFPLDYQITDKNISNLVSKLKSMPEFVPKMKELQEFGLMVATYESSSDLSIENLMQSQTKVPKSEMGDADGIAVYGKSIELIGGVTPLNDSLKGSRAAISSIVNPQMVYVDNAFVLTSDSMLGAMSASEYVRVSAEFRKVQQVKVNSVGESGYLSRQIWTVMSHLVYSDAEAKPKKLLEIIPDSDGTRYANCLPIQVKSGVPVKVDSVIFNSDNFVFKNDLYESMEYKDGHLIGIDFGMQISEGTTQGILKLKHEGGFLSYSAYGLLQAESDCEVLHDSNYIYVNGTKFLKSPKFKFVDPNKKKYKKGDLIGINPTLVSPNTNLYLMMKLLSAMGTTSVYSKPKLHANLYSVTSGVVKLVDNYVEISGHRYYMPDESLCLVYDGQKVGVGTKLFTGPLNYKNFVASHANLGVDVLYKIFVNEMKSFANVKSILLEFLFKAIHYVDVLENGEEAIAFKGITGAIDPNEDLLTSLTMGFIKKKLSGFIASDSSEMGESNLINIAYQFNGVRLGAFANKALEDATKKAIENQ